MSKKPNKKQLAVLDDLFASDLSAEQILEKHRVTNSLYSRWQSDDSYIAELDRRIELLGRNSRILIAKYSSIAAAKLIALTDSANQETARKACLDIISLLKDENPKTRPDSADPQPGTLPKIAPALAEKLLATIAEQ
jgi:hypothetical protein